VTHVSAPHPAYWDTLTLTFITGPGDCGRSSNGVGRFSRPAWRPLVMAPVSWKGSRAPIPRGSRVGAKVKPPPLGGLWTRPPVESRRFWVSVGNRTYTVEIDGGRPERHFNLVDERSIPVLSWTGRHFNHDAGTRLTLLDGTTYRLPVSGTFATPIMSAVADKGDGRPIISYRLKPPLLPRKRRPTLAITTNRQDYFVEVVVRPEAQHSMPSVPLFVSIRSHLLRRFFLEPGGGG
jgi:hypothetical protein